ncbi:MAG: sodium:solute symporter, partial [Chitinophagales bacterium]|nr:sodium:solute symporter [Chitinophagales bacterium]MDW8274186.1 sodium:solute symporter [Chitinophagales bacterium]
MNFLDWVVLISTLLLIIVYGLIKSKGSGTIKDYFLGDRTMPWYMVMFSVITTQASAITFISAPGQAYSDGMRFVQFYFGLPLAMLVVSFVFMPKFIEVNVITAYQYLEQRFDVKTRSLAALLFLLQRSLSAGLTIYAPAVILSVILGWNIWIANFVMGGFVILYTVSGGSRAVAYTQMQQMLVITIGMCVAGFMAVKLLPENINFKQAIDIADATGCMNTITTNFSWNDKYNIWSGLIGGFFLSLSYFGTDQSQVGRYISAKNVSESRMGLLTTAAVKIPMQYLILLIGALLISLFHFEKPPVFFNTAAWQKAKESNQRHECLWIEKKLDEIFVSKKETARSYLAAKTSSERKIYKEKIRQLHQKEKELRKSALSILKKSGVTSETSDVNYVFLYFV